MEDLDAIAGYRLLRIEGVENRVDIPPLFDARIGLDPVTTNDLFAQASWRIAAPLRLIGGVRVSLLPDDYRGTRRLKTDKVPVRESVSVEDASPFNGQLALLWTPTPDQVSKLAWGTGSQDSDQLRIGEPVPAYWNVGLNLRWDPAGTGPYADLNHLALRPERQCR